MENLNAQQHAAVDTPHALKLSRQPRARLKEGIDSSANNCMDKAYGRMLKAFH